ncbi:PqiC family protein [Paucibacter sp. APW11]|uniref:PqiC family protein n=1 Tax=Roseateles aquae TaxID=3077235 RepID=A0ABU3P8A3_9BURK|nr:PqiC family protein [Paucibacter sp. APW11]MDT8998811.1 PqiC family protein [Paucibacter sp. APW11]
MSKPWRDLGVLVAIPALLAGCSSSPPVQLYQLRAEAPVTTPSVAASTVWALGPVLLPDYLDRDAIVRPSGAASLQHNPSQRWAEPLREAVPRLLAQDLAQLRGSAQVWRMPVPPGVQVDRQLRVDVQRLDAKADSRQVVLQARWTLVDPSGKTKPVVLERRIELEASDASVDALVSAHRSALWQLAEAIAASP